MTRLEALNAMIVKLGGEGTATNELAAWQAVKTQMDAIVVVLNSISGGTETLYQTALDAVVVAQGGTGGGDILELCNELAVLLGAATGLDVLTAINNIITELGGTTKENVLAAYEELGALLNEPAIEWDFEGVMTVGEMTEPFLANGFSDGSLLPLFGVLSDYIGFVAYSSAIGGVMSVIEVDEVQYYIYKLEIDGVLFENGVASEGTFFATETDPFPAVGETCTIKVKKGEAIPSPE